MNTMLRHQTQPTYNTCMATCVAMVPSFHGALICRSPLHSNLSRRPVDYE
jgi:hypothetical protein